MAIPLAMISRVCKRVHDDERQVEPQQEPELKEPSPIPPPVQEPVWIFFTAKSQAYKEGAKVHAARAGQLVSLCNKLSTDKAASVQRPPEAVMCAPCRAAICRERNTASFALSDQHHAELQEA